MCTANDDNDDDDEDDDDDVVGDGDSDIDSRNTHEWPSKQGGLWDSRRSRYGFGTGMMMMTMVELATSNWRGRANPERTNILTNYPFYTHRLLSWSRLAERLSWLPYSHTDAHTHTHRYIGLPVHTHTHTHSLLLNVPMCTHSCAVVLVLNFVVVVGRERVLCT